jgi:hypothetical protein
MVTPQAASVAYPAMRPFEQRGHMHFHFHIPLLGVKTHTAAAAEGALAVPYRSLLSAQLWNVTESCLHSRNFITRLIVNVHKRQNNFWNQQLYLVQNFVP